jgi:uncharacterized protein YbjT (DUF2867 family)
MELANVLLIGGSGFVGGWIASRLSERGIRVTIPTRHRENTKKLTMLPTISMVEANVHDRQTLVQLMRGQDAVINLVGILHDQRFAPAVWQGLCCSACRPADERSSPRCGKAAFAAWYT